MIDVDELDDEVREAIMSNLDTDDVEAVKPLSVYEAFDRFLTWNGIIGYTAVIMDALDNIREAGDD